MADFWRDFWIRETGTGQKVAQLHDRYIIIIIIIIIIICLNPNCMSEEGHEQAHILFFQCTVYKSMKRVQN